MSATRIVVGVDGSEHSEYAVRWAANEAQRRNAPLQVLYAYEWAWHGAQFTNMPPIEAEAKAHADEVVGAAVAEARYTASDVDVIGQAVRGKPAEVLLNAGRAAAMIVMGSRGHGGFVNLLLGSVSQQVTTHATCPVVVVHGPAASTDGPVVVGVDIAAEAGTALAASFDAASARGCSLVAVHAYTPPSPPWGSGVAPVVRDTTEIEVEERKRLVDVVNSWSDKYPGVKVESLIAKGQPADVLVGVSKGAQLVVVGARGHGGFAELLLGSISQQVVQHAKCPVLVARSATTS
jgi:nucleotide-binding universal stress UspA family protein